MTKYGPNLGKKVFSILSNAVPIGQSKKLLIFHEEVHLPCTLCSLLMTVQCIVH